MSPSPHFHILANNMAEYGNREGVTQSPPLQTAVDTEQFRNIQESVRYGMHVSGTKYYIPMLPMDLETLLL